MYFSYSCFLLQLSKIEFDCLLETNNLVKKMLILKYLIIIYENEIEKH